MRVAFISEHASPLAILGGIDNGGQNVYVAELSRELANNGYCVDIYTRKESRLQREIVEWLPGIRVIHIKAGAEEPIDKENLLGHMKEFTDNMLHFIRRHRMYYSLIHAHFFMSAMVASAIRRTLRVPYVVTFHALGLVRKAFQKEMDKFPPERCTIERFIVGDADRIIAECPQDRADLIKYYRADPEKISVVPCGFNPEEFRPYDRMEARERLSLPMHEKILLQLGRMVPRKGVDNVIRALGRLRADEREIRLVVVGGNSDQPDPSLTPEIGRLQEVAREEGIAHRVQFVGRKDRQVLPFYYAAADLFITTPWYEPFGITPLEAMACGIPVVGSRTGGVKYSVADGKTGFLVPPKDPDSLARKVGHLLDNPLLAEKMGKNAIRRVHKLFTWKKVSRQIADVYELVEKEVRREQMLQHRSSREKEFFSLHAAGTMLRQPFFPVFNLPGS
ncbi:MAG TPA: glycosyltransferase family 1 protein [Puia sp.]|jgi:glycosyltransferase involved in cell wall biosynthesis|nr:glycosyltransferase family 1 protein [Puia sp.]